MDFNDVEIIGIGENSRRLVEDFRYIFSDKISIINATFWNEDVVDFRADSMDKCDVYVCCTYDKALASKRFEKIGMTYKKDYVFAEDLFYLLDDWKDCKIAYKSYPGTLKGCIRAIVFGYAAKHGKIIPQDKYKSILKGDYHKPDNKKRNPWVDLGIVCLKYIIPGSFSAISQLSASGNGYKNYDYICFENIAGAIKFRRDFPELISKVITTEELKNHTMASLYMKAVYYDRRQNDCNCKVPLETIWIGDKGTTRLCGCPDYLDISCGNMGITDNDEIWNSTLAKILRLSVINNTYTFCSRELCREFNGNPDGDELLERKEADFTREYPNIIKVANDYVCNLHCPSCRKMIHAKNDDNEELEIVTCIDSLMESGWLDKANNVVVGASGESFLSPSYRKIIFDGVAHRNSIDIMTNGTLFTPQIWEKMEGKYKHVTFSVSIDAATKETYEKVRCGGNWDKLMENMAFLSKLRKENKVESVMVNMIVQKKNYREIPDFIRWAKEMEFDSVYLSHIWNWGTFSADEFENEVSMFDKDGKMKTELAKVLEDPICKDPIVDMRWE